MPITDSGGEIVLKIVGADGKPVVGAHVQVGETDTPPVVPPTPPVVPPASGVVDVPGTITSTGVADVTAALQSFLAGLPTGATARLKAGGFYRVDGTLLLTDSDVTVDMNGATIQAGPEKGQTGSALLNLSLMKVLGGKFRIKNGKLKGRNPAGGAEAGYDATRESQHLLDVRGCDQLRATDMTLTDTWGDCVYLGVHDGQGCGDVAIVGGELARTGRQGVAMVAAQKVVIDRVYLHDMRRATFNMEPNGAAPWGAVDVEIMNCRTGPGRLIWFSSGGFGVNVSNIRIHHNTMEAATGAPVIFMHAGSSPVGGFRGPLVIEDNVFLVAGSPSAGIDLKGVRDVTIRRNRITFPMERSMTAVALTRCQNVKIEDNVFLGAARQFRADELTTGLTVTGNTGLVPSTP